MVHYRWHPLYGRRVCLRRSEQRSSGRFVQIEAEPGIVTYADLPLPLPRGIVSAALRQKS